jgi:transglutaminase-like putative cysteine protease
MVQRVATVAFEGIEARAVDVQVQVAPGLPAFNIVGLPDKAVSEAKERVRAALVASGLAPAARPLLEPEMYKLARNLRKRAKELEERAATIEQALATRARYRPKKLEEAVRKQEAKKARAQRVRRGPRAFNPTEAVDPSIFDEL